MSAKRLLITGGAGFVGSNLITLLATKEGYDITVLDDESLGSPDVIRPLVNRYEKGDIRDRDLLDVVLADRDTVVHLAADTRVMDSIAAPSHNFEVNVVGTFYLLEAARKAGIACFINASTGGAILGEATPPVHEEMVPRPLAPYGASKLAVEGYCNAYGGAYGLNVVSLRFSNLYGPLSFHKGSVVAHFFKCILKGEPLVVYGDGSQTRDYLFIGDLVEGIHQAINISANGIYQLGSGIPVTLNELIAIMQKIVGETIPLEVIYKEHRAGEILHTWCDTAKAKTELDFSAPTDLHQGLARTWQWFQENSARFT